VTWERGLQYHVVVQMRLAVMMYQVICKIAALFVLSTDLHGLLEQDEDCRKRKFFLTPALSRFDKRLRTCSSTTRSESKSPVNCIYVMHVYFSMIVAASSWTTKRKHRWC
jgi:hypothetical protein